MSDKIKIQKTWIQENGFFKCPYCGVEKAKKGIATHIFFKHTERGNEVLKTQTLKNLKSGNFNKSPNRGKTYEEIFGIEKARVIKNKISKALIGAPRIVSEEGEMLRRKKISETMKKNPKSGGLREGSGRGSKMWYESKIAGKVYLRSTYEIEYAKWLDKNEIGWRINKKAFLYEWEDKTRKYFPDFYLINENSYVEIKGFKTAKDEAKWKNFPHGLQILYGKDLIKLGIKVTL